MKMKKYIAATMPEAMKAIRKELGDEAVILSSKVVYSKGFLGMFKKKSIEVLAGMDSIELSNKAANLPTVQLDPDSNQTLEIKKELEDIKNMVKSIQRPQLEQQYSEELHTLIHHLKQQELTEELITRVSDELFVHGKKTIEEQLHFTKNYLNNILSDLSFGGISYERKFINVLGPTGVGKTTTIAKMAARAVLEKKKK